jgi:hypothetical protein
MWLAGPAGPAFEIWDSFSSLTAPAELQEQAGIMIRDIMTPAFLDLFDDTKSKEAQEQLRAALERNIAFPKGRPTDTIAAYSCVALLFTESPATNQCPAQLTPPQCKPNFDTGWPWT